MFRSEKMTPKINFASSASLTFLDRLTGWCPALVGAIEVGAGFVVEALATTVVGGRTHRLWYMHSVWRSKM